MIRTVGFGMMWANRREDLAPPAGPDQEPSFLRKERPMAASNHTARDPYVHPDDPTGWLKPDEPLMVNGLDWSWCYVVYKEVAGFLAYQIGTNGYLWTSHGGNWKRKRYRPWERIKGGNEGGYLRVTISLNGMSRRRFIHEIVLETFVGPCPPGMECRHLNGNSSDNRLSNLRWGTPAENCADKELHGTMARGSKSGNAKLTEDDVAEIHSRVAGGETHRSIAKHFGIHGSRISRISRRQEWAHVEGNDVTKAMVGVDNRVGSKNRFAKLTEDDIREIRRLKRAGATQRQLGVLYGINQATICRIAKKETWAHVD